MPLVTIGIRDNVIAYVDLDLDKKAKRRAINADCDHVMTSEYTDEIKQAFLNGSSVDVSILRKAPNINGKNFETYTWDRNPELRTFDQKAERQIWAHISEISRLELIRSKKHDLLLLRIYTKETTPIYVTYIKSLMLEKIRMHLIVNENEQGEFKILFDGYEELAEKTYAEVGQLFQSEEISSKVIEIKL